LLGWLASRLSDTGWLASRLSDTGWLAGWLAEFVFCLLHLLENHFGHTIHVLEIQQMGREGAERWLSL
jgi:hypothetical protein